MDVHGERRCASARCSTRRTRAETLACANPYRPGVTIRSTSISPALAVHVSAGASALVTGFVALGAAKGSVLHRRSGALFVYLMLVMALTGAAIAVVEASGPRPKTGTQATAFMGLFTAYLVVTALTTVRPPSTWSRRLGLLGVPLAAAIGVGLTTLGLRALTTTGNHQMLMLTAVELVFGSIALLAAGSDVRLLRSSSPLTGTKRIARHLWRMTFALWIAVFSFFPRLIKHIPAPFGAVVAVPILGVLGAMLYWLWRVRYRKSFRGLIGVAVPRSNAA